MLAGAAAEIEQAPVGTRFQDAEQQGALTLEPPGPGDESSIVEPRVPVFGRQPSPLKYETMACRSASPRPGLPPLGGMSTPLVFNG